MILRRLKHLAGRIFFAPNPQIDAAGKTIRIGSEYGGWTFLPLEGLEGCTIISAGLGEDASFDVEFARKFHARVIMVDPTPRAIAHCTSLCARISHPRTHNYVSGGHQPPEAYPLDGLNPDQLVLEPSALWTKATTLKFYSPPDPQHVSHSLVDFQNCYSQKGGSIEVESTTLQGLMEKYKVSELELLKLDIEGAEIAVLEDMLERGIRPRQILVEFDELTLRTRLALRRWQSSDMLLREHKYACVYFDGLSCFTYVRVDAGLT